MSQWTIYTVASGEIVHSISDPYGPLNDIQPGQLFVAGAYSTFTHYVVEGQAINRPHFPIVINNNEEPYLTGKFRIDDVPVGTVVSYDETEVTVNDGYFELTSLAEGTVKVTLTLFPYVPRTINAIFTA